MPSNSSPAFFGLTPATKHARPFAYSRHMRVWNWPVLPVIPCVITLVFLSIRIAIASTSLRGGDGLLGRLRHVRRRDDRQAGFREDLAAELLVRPLHAHDQGHFQRHRLRRG